MSDAADRRRPGMECVTRRPGDARSAAGDRIQPEEVAKICHVGRRGTIKEGSVQGMAHCRADSRRRRLLSCRITTSTLKSTGGVFEQYIPHLTVLVNAIYWSAKYPRLATKAYLKELFSGAKPRLRVIGDISCDVEGAIECTVKATDPGDPLFVYEPLTGTVTDGHEGPGVVVVAVDILPSELPREASVDFSRILKPFIPAIATADFSTPFEASSLPPEIKRAVIAYRGQLTPDYQYIEQFLG